MIQALLIVTVIMTGAAAFLGNGWLNAREQVGELKVSFQAQRLEVTKAKDANDKLKTDIYKKSLALDRSLQNRRIENARTDREIASLRSKVSSTQTAAEKYPARYARTATNILNRELWRACKSSGGKFGSECKFKRLKNPKAGHLSKPKPKLVQSSKRDKEGKQ
jgi:septal ring factor EnvC (AmiA/AmiB activator)